MKTIKHALGWIPDVPDARDLELKMPMRAVRAAALKPVCDDIRPLIAAVKPYDQGAIGSCHDDRTEVLTDSGWRLFCDVRHDDLLASANAKTGRIIFEKPTRMVQFDYSGAMVYCENQSLDFAVTPDHQMLVRKWSEHGRTLEDEYSLVDARNLGWYCGLLHRCESDGAHSADEYIDLPGVAHRHLGQRSARRVKMDAWLRFLGIYLAEGTVLNEVRKRRRQLVSGETEYECRSYKIQIAASKVREKQFVRNVLSDMGLAALELDDRFTIENKQVFHALESLGLYGVKAPQKFVPRFIFGLPAVQIRAFLEGHFNGDGCEQNGAKSHYTSSRQLADDLHALVVLAGDWGTVGSRPPRASIMKDGRMVIGRNPEYRVSRWAGRGLAIERKDSVRIGNYSGKVFCAEVPINHTLITRRNGKVLISGNCTGNMGAGAVVVQQARQKKKPDTPSRLALYYDARVLQGWQNSDTGAYIRDIFKVLQKHGAGSETLHPYKERDFKKRPSASYYAAATKQQALKYERVPQTLNQMKAVLAEGNPINLGFTVYESIADASLDGIINLPQTGERAEGGHAVLVVGYTNDLKKVHSRGSKLSLPKFAKTIPEWFIVRNSWGTGWGDKGYCYIPASYLTNANLCADLWRLLLLE